MRKQFIVGSFIDPGFGNFVTKLWFEKSKWFDKVHQRITIQESIKYGICI
jgi:hypothetical protein